MSSKNIIITVILVVIFAAAGFFTGMNYEKSKTFSLGMMMNGRNDSFAGRGYGRFGGMNGSNGMQAVRGQIVSVDSNSVTIKLSDGSSKIVVLPSSATIYKTDKATTSDLSSGENVMVFGTTNSDGSVTAQMVQLNPMNRLNAMPSNNPTPNSTGY